MIKIGLVGEDPNDTSSIRNLLSKEYKDKAQFIPLIKGIRGHQLDNPKTKRSLAVEFEPDKHSFVLYVRDLDGFKSNEEKIKKYETWFKDLDSVTNKNGILLLNIWELEALIFSDINTVNEKYKISHKYAGDPTTIKEPKEKLMELTRNSKNPYKESHCPEIFEKLNFQNVKKCSRFKEFLVKFDEKLASLAPIESKLKDKKNPRKKR